MYQDPRAQKRSTSAKHPKIASYVQIMLQQEKEPPAVDSEKTHNKKRQHTYRCEEEELLRRQRKNGRAGKRQQTPSNMNNKRHSSRRVGDKRGPSEGRRENRQSGQQKQQNRLSNKTATVNRPITDRHREVECRFLRLFWLDHWCRWRKEYTQPEKSMTVSIERNLRRETRAGSAAYLVRMMTGNTSLAPTWWKRTQESSNHRRGQHSLPIIRDHQTEE